ncbi:early meiotic induction 1, partial [Fusarium heterosporum]
MSPNLKNPITISNAAQDSGNLQFLIFFASGLEDLESSTSNQFFNLYGIAMGWLWSSAPPSEDKTSAPVKETPPTISTTSTSTSISAPITTPSSNSNADPEIQKFLELFEAEKNAKPSPATQEEESSSTSTLPSWLTLKKSSRPSAPMPSDIPPRDPLSEALLPAEMSCRQAFDQAWACNS